MKKLVSLLLVVGMCLSIGAALTACDEEHTHTYKTEWENDATHHWHVCEGEDCADVTDKAEHTWNDGEITTEATAEADGVKTFTCTVCGQTKTETVKYTVKETVTKEEWETAFAFDCAFLQRKMNGYEDSTHIVYAESNIAYTKIKMIEYYPDDQIMAIDYMEKVDGGWYCYNDETQSGDIDAVREYTKQYQTPEDCHGDDEFESTKNAPKNSVSQFAECFEQFKYDDDKNAYVADSIDSEYSNITISFNQGKIHKVCYTDKWYTYEIEFNYDEIEIVLPEVTE